MYDVFASLLEQRNVKAADVAKATGIHPSTFSDWKKGKSAPKADKLQRIADYFGVTLEYLMNGPSASADAETYYLNDDARDFAQFLFENPEYKVLFDASRKIRKEDIQFVKDFLDRVSKV